MARLSKRVSASILQSLGAGVVPRVGLDHIAVGRSEETTALLNDLDNIVSEGGATFRLILGRYGSGKSFLGQLVRNYAMDRNFVVADADLSPVKRLTGSKGQGLALYQELLKNMATRTRPGGNAFSAILERWINEVQNSVMQEQNLTPTDPEFSREVQKSIHNTIDEMEGMVHGFDFAKVLNGYWQGYQDHNDELQNSALQWLRGEFSTKTEARKSLDVRVIIDDDSWYDYVKILARFVKDIGYTGLVIFLDEGVNLYKISNTVARNNNYERLLTIYNDTLQGKAEYLGIIFGGTPQMVEDMHRGLFSYEALRTRLQESRFTRNGLRDLSSPLIRLEILSPNEIFLLLQNLQTVHATHHKYEEYLKDSQIQYFMNEVVNRLGASELLTPREVVRDFITILNLLLDNPDKTFEEIMGVDFIPTKQGQDPEMMIAENEILDDDSPYGTFQL